MSVYKCMRVVYGVRHYERYSLIIQIEMKWTLSHTLSLFLCLVLAIVIIVIVLVWWGKKENVLSSLSASLYAASFCVLLQYSEKGGVGVFLGVSPKPINHTKPMLMYSLCCCCYYYYFYCYYDDVWLANEWATRGLKWYNEWKTAEFVLLTRV